MAKSLEDKLGLNLPLKHSVVELAPQDNDNNSSVSSATSEASFEQQQVHQLARSNLDFLAALAMPDSITFMFPPTYIAVWTWLQTYIHKPRDFSKLALGLPRGFAKTTLIKIFILYCILFTSRKYILVTAATATLANNIIADVVDMLNETNIKRVFGDWSLGLEKDTQDLKKFGFRGRNIILQGMGQGGSVRGTNLKNSRPDVMIFEDIQSREDAESQVISEGIEKWMLGTAMKAKAFDGCLYIFVANMYPTKWSLLRRLKSNSSWTKFIAGGILADGTSLWEELQPIEQLLEEFQNDLNSGHPEIFYSEVLNDENASVNTSIDLSKIPDYPFYGAISAGNFIVIDPSNDKANSDYVSIGLFEIYEGIPTLTKLIEDRLSPGETIRQTLQIAIEARCSLIVIEANAYQYSLCYWFDNIMAQYGLSGIQAVPIYSGSLAKNSRILTMFKQLVPSRETTNYLPELVIHPDVRSQVYMQITQFNALRRDNTDGILDLLSYAPRVLTEFSHYITLNSYLGNDDFNNARVYDIADNCSF